ncbi:MAG: hypothetical protein LUE89_00380 [Clostridiales bacterium]|nr:hypothetical protein [Clostridiales bacterium]
MDNICLGIDLDAIGQQMRENTEKAIAAAKAKRHEPKKPIEEMTWKELVIELDTIKRREAAEK